MRENSADHNRRFHEAIYYCSHNRYILKNIAVHPDRDASFAARSGTDRRETALREHRAIVSAIASHGPWRR
jgi:DNA-binding GntR family transcriptional regulator